MFANNSFYTGMHTFSGIMFGAFEFSWVRGAFLQFDVLTFLALSLCPLAYLAALKSMHEAAGKQTYTLARPYRHIFADFLFFISIAASFSTLVYIYANGLSFSNRDLSVPPHTAILLFNLILFALSMGLLSLLAKEERRKLEAPARGT